MKIQFLKDLNDCVLPEIPEDTYVIYKKGYDIPDIKGIRGKFEFDEFKAVYSNLHANMYIVFGLNKIITPSNRTQFVFEHLFSLSSDIEKYSIDYLPFIGETWRLWFHYGMCQVGKFGIPHSYAIETEWKHWFYRNMNDSRFEHKNLKICITDTYCDLDALNHEVTFQPTNSIDDEWYNEAKKHVFEKYDTPKMIINNLLKLCNKRFGLDYSYNSYLSKDRFKLPELNIYKFVNEENIRRVNSFNVFTKMNNENIRH